MNEPVDILVIQINKNELQYQVPLEVADERVKNMLPESARLCIVFDDPMRAEAFCAKSGFHARFIYLNQPLPVVNIKKGN